ncbi:MAG: hypothetical protein SXQ77_03550, partial [Halobacteria archaeon]|nr:hypothetical protein [Halobacteria archaeon]
VMTVASVGDEKVTEVEEGGEYSDAEIENLVRVETKKAAVEVGGSRDAQTEIIDMRSFNVVEGSRVSGQIIDATAQVVPGLNEFFAPGGDSE